MDLIYRSGAVQPSNLKPRADEDSLSFRDSLSNPWPLPAGQRPVFSLGGRWFAIDVSQLPFESVIMDNEPEGHILVRDVSVDELKQAVIARGKFPP